MLLRTGLEVLTEKGFSATGLDEILGRAGVPKGSFYHYFDSKEAFGLELIDRYADFFARKLDRHFSQPEPSPLARVRAFVDDARDGMARHEYSRGCLIGNLGQEMGALPESFRARLRATFEDWQRRLAACLTAAQQPASSPIRQTPRSWPHASGSAGKARCCARSSNAATCRLRCSRSFSSMDCLAAEFFCH